MFHGMRFIKKSFGVWFASQEAPPTIRLGIRGFPPSRVFILARAETIVPDRVAREAK
jgi:hypothetical protein